MPYVVDLLFLVLLFEFGLGPLALIDKLFINIAIVIQIFYRNIYMIANVKEINNNNNNNNDNNDDNNDNNNNNNNNNNSNLNSLGIKFESKTKSFAFLEQIITKKGISDLKRKKSKKVIILFYIFKLAYNQFYNN